MATTMATAKAKVAALSTVFVISRNLRFASPSIQFGESLMHSAHGARVVLVHRIRRKNENIGACLAVRGQPFDTSRGRSDQRNRIGELVGDRRRHRTGVA